MEVPVAVAFFSILNNFVTFKLYTSSVALLSKYFSSSEVLKYKILIPKSSASHVDSKVSLKFYNLWILPEKLVYLDVLTCKFSSGSYSVIVVLLVTHLILIFA